MNGFETLGLSANLLNGIAALGYDKPTPIQASAIPPVLAGKDLLGLAQTGTGKTAAFGLPLVQLLLDGKDRAKPRSIRALILAPTRELANQIGDNLRSFVKRTPLRIVTVVGGASINTQTRNLERGTDVLIATPGRLLDLCERGAVSIATARFLVLDEADQMLDLGFIHALRKIASMVGSPRQTLLFSATMPKAISQLAASFLTDPVRVEAAPSGKTADKITQAVHFAPQAQKAGLLAEMLARDPANLSLVFVRTKHGAEKLLKFLVANGIDAVSIHGNKSQGQRERAIRAFRDGDVRVLVATDVAARGIDIPGVSHVYNHDLPEVAEAYVHRIGRTARAGASGDAISLCAPDENHLLRAIERLTGQPLVRLNAAAAPQGEPRVAEPGKPARRRNRNRNRNGADPSHKPAREAEIAHQRVSEGNYTPRGEPRVERTTRVNTERHGERKQDRRDARPAPQARQGEQLPGRQRDKRRTRRPRKLATA